MASLGVLRIHSSWAKPDALSGKGCQLEQGNTAEETEQWRKAEQLFFACIFLSHAVRGQSNLA